MKVVICSPYYGVNPNNPGGIAIWARNINAYYETHVKDVELDICPIDREHDFDNVLSLKRIWYGVKEYWRNIKKVKAFVKDKDYDVMHVCSSASLSLLKDYLFMLVAKMYTMKTTIHFHFGRIPKVFAAKNWEYRLINLVIKKADHIVVMDMKSYNTLLNAGYNNITYLPNPLSTSVCMAIEKVASFSCSREEGSVLFAGHIIPSKGVFELIEACSRIKTVKKLTMIGYIEDINVKDELMVRADQIRGYHDWVVFTGGIPHEQVIKEMLTCSLFVLPSYTEGFPNVILESMACACPIISTPVGAIPEMLDSQSSEPCGSLVDVGDVKGLQSMIESYLELRDEALIMGYRAQKRVNTVYSIDIVWKRLINVWETASKLSN